MYRVQGSDGIPYDAPSLAVLQEWVNEGRIISTTIVEDLLGGTQGPASGIEGLVFSRVGPVADSTANSGYPRSAPVADWTIHLPLVKAVISALCCTPFGLVAVVYAARVPEIMARGDQERARKAIRMANIWSNISLLSFIAWMIVWAKYFVPLLPK